MRDRNFESGPFNEGPIERFALTMSAILATWMASWTTSALVLPFLFSNWSKENECLRVKRSRREGGGGLAIDFTFSFTTIGIVKADRIVSFYGNATRDMTIIVELGAGSSTSKGSGQFTITRMPGNLVGMTSRVFLQRLWSWLALPWFCSVLANASPNARDIFRIGSDQGSEKGTSSGRKSSYHSLIDNDGSFDVFGCFTDVSLVSIGSGLR